MKKLDSMGLKAMLLAGLFLNNVGLWAGVPAGSRCNLNGGMVTNLGGESFDVIPGAQTSAEAEQIWRQLNAISIADGTVEFREVIEDNENGAVSYQVHFYWHTFDVVRDTGDANPDPDSPPSNSVPQAPSETNPGSGPRPDPSDPVNDFGQSQVYSGNAVGCATGGCGGAGGSVNSSGAFAIAIGLGRNAQGNPLGHLWYHGDLATNLGRSTPPTSNQIFSNLFIRQYDPGSLVVIPESSTANKEWTFLTSDGYVKVQRVDSEGSMTVEILFKSDANGPVEAKHVVYLSQVAQEGVIHANVQQTLTYTKEVAGAAAQVWSFTSSGTPDLVDWRYGFPDGRVERIDKTITAQTNGIETASIWRKQINWPDEAQEFDSEVRTHLVNGRIVVVEEFAIIPGFAGDFQTTGANKVPTGRLLRGEEHTEGHDPLVWTASMDGKWSLRIRHPRAEGLPEEVPYYNIVTYEPWLDGPAQVGPINFATAERDSIRTHMLALRDDAENDALYDCVKTHRWTTYSPGIGTPMEVHEKKTRHVLGSPVGNLAPSWQLIGEEDSGVRWPNEPTAALRYLGKMCWLKAFHINKDSGGIGSIETGNWEYDRDDGDATVITLDQSHRMTVRRRIAWPGAGAEQKGWEERSYQATFTSDSTANYRKVESVEPTAEPYVRELLSGSAQVVERQHWAQVAAGSPPVLLSTEAWERPRNTRSETRKLNGIIVGTETREADVGTGGDRITATDEAGAQSTAVVTSLGETIWQEEGPIPAFAGAPALPALKTTVIESPSSSGKVKVTSIQPSGGAVRLLSTETRLPFSSSVTSASGVTRHQMRIQGERLDRLVSPGQVQFQNIVQDTRHYLDGRVKSVTGPTVLDEVHQFRVNEGSSAAYPAGTITETIYYDPPSLAAPESASHWLRITRTASGRVLREERPSANSALAAQGTPEVKTYHYDTEGRLVRLTQTGLADQHWQFDSEGRLKQQGRDLDGDGQLTLTSATDEVTETSYEYRDFEAHKFAVTIRRAAVGVGQMVTTETWESADGSPDSIRLETDGQGKVTIWRRVVNRSATQVTETEESYFGVIGGTLTAIPGSYSRRVTVGGLLMENQVPGALEPIRYRYDAYRQLVETHHPAQGVETLTYLPDGRLQSRTNSSGVTTSYAYYSSISYAWDLVQSEVTSHAGEAAPRTRFYYYDEHRRLTRVWGNSVTPVRYEYDVMGRLTAMTTYDDTTHDWSLPNPGDHHLLFSPVGRRTQWLYVAGTHQTERKIDAAGRAVDYAYHPGGLLWQRKWARTNASGDRVTTTYSYHTVSGDAEKRIPGRLAGLTYSDGVTPSVALEYRQDGRPARVQDAAGVTETQFPAGVPGGWTWGQQTLPGSGLLAGHRLSSTGPHPGFGLTFEAAPAEGTGPWVSLQRTWSGLGVPQSVSDLLSGVSHSYDREDATGRVRRMISQVTGGPELALHRRQEHEPANLGGVLAAVSYTRGSEAWTASSRVLGWRYTLSGGVRRAVRPYSVTGAGQVPEAAQGWDWTYNPRGEVVSAARKRTNGSPEILVGEVWDYEFDASGNRVRQSRGRSLNMANGQMTPYEFNAFKFLSASLTTDSTNALTSLTRAPGLEVKGAAPENHAVSIRVNEGTEEPVDRQDWRRKLADPGGFQRPIPSGTQAEWRRVELKAQGAPGTPPDLRSGWVFSPPPQETLVHDLDGNLVEDARWVYTWDAENRLIGMQEKVIPVAAGMDPTTGPKRLKLEFAYDAQHRRIAKVVKEWAGDAVTGGFTNVVKDRRYVYDGWNMIAELDHTTATGTGLAGASVVRTQVWAIDLSGTMQGAGGVGGLLAVRHDGQTYVPLMDGNGNVMGLQGLGGAKDGQTVARYDYDAFGNRITNTAPELGEEVNPFGFSTKFTDEETGLVYYGYRYYSAELGRWLSRDPIGERGGINLYGMVGNDPVNRVDRLGHAPANFKCGGTCGANVDDWIVDEINAQRAGWTGGNKSISGYLRWANGNQRYKDPAFFEFSKDTKCGTIDTGSAVGCGSSVTLCGQCVRSAILGNLMYGLIAADAGFPMEDTVNAPGDTKRFLRMTVSANDETSYLSGDIMGTKLPKNITLKDVCYRLNGIAFGLPSALRETNASGGENDLTSCRPCQEKTKESRHGGSDKPRWTR